MAHPSKEAERIRKHNLARERWARRKLRKKTYERPKFKKRQFDDGEE